MVESRGESLVFSFKAGRKFTITFTVPPVRASTKPEIIVHSRWVPYMPANLVGDEQSDYDREKATTLTSSLGFLKSRSGPRPVRTKPR
jgi:hypothetical protein